MDKTQKELFANFEEHYKFFLNGWNSKLYISPKIYSKNGNQLSLIDKIIEQVDGPSISPIVILGDSGMGKTSLGLHLCNIFWQRIQTAVQQNLLQNSLRMPIYTTYPKLLDNQRSLLSEIFEPEEKISNIENSLKSHPLLIVIDAFKVINQEGVEGDSENFFQNLHLPWNEFSDIKFVVLCRNDSVPENPSVLNNLFQLVNGDQTASPIQSTLQLLQPFDNSQIKQYIDKFTEVLKETPASSLSDSISHDYNLFSNISMTKLVTHGTDWEKTSDKFMNCFSAHLDLYELAKIPFILHHILLVLPHVMEKTEDESTDDITKFCLAKTAIIETFIQHWFKFQAQRLLKMSPDPFKMNKDLTIDELTCFFEVYAQHLARKCIIDNILQDHLIKTEITEDWRLAEPNLIPDKRMLDLYKIIFKCENDKDPNEKTKKMENLKILREACPLQKLESGFRFSHFTFALYFASQEVFNGVEEIYQAVVENKDTEKRLNATGWSPVSLVTQIVDEHIINALADRVKCNDLLEKHLRKFIDLSKTVSLIKVVASNAITILCRANCSFSNEDLRNVQIPKARLDGGLFGGADFRGADLTQVSFHHAWLPRVKLSGAKLSRVNFGQTPSIQFDRNGKDMCSDITSIVSYSHSENEYWLVCFGMRLIEVNVETFKTKRDIVCWDEEGALRYLQGMHSALFGDSHVLIWTDVGIEVKIWDYKTESATNSTPRKIVDLDVSHSMEALPSMPSGLEIQCLYPYFGVLYCYELVIYKIEGDCEDMQTLHSVRISFFPNLCDISTSGNRRRYCTFSIHQNILVFTGNESVSLISNFHHPDETKVLKKVFTKDVSYFRNTIFSPSGNFLAFSSGKTIWIICKPSQVDVNNLDINQQELTGHQFQVSGLTFWEDNSSARLASCCTEKVIIWDFSNKKFQQHTMISTVYPAGALLAFNSDGSLLGCAGNRENGFDVWDAECTRFTTSRVPDEIYSTWKMPEVKILRILPDSNLVVLALTSKYITNHYDKSEHDWLQIHDRNSGLKKSEIKCDVGLIYSLECLHKIRENSDVKIIVLGQTCGTRIQLALCNTECFITKLLLTDASDNLSAAVINCNPFIIASGIGKNLMVWRFSTSSSCNEDRIKQIHQYTFPKQSNIFVECDSVALDTKGKYAAASSNEKVIYIFNLENEGDSWFHEHDVKARVRCIRFQDKNWNNNENSIIFAVTTPTFVLIFCLSTLDNKCVLLKELKDDMLTFQEIGFIGEKYIMLKGLGSAIVIITEEQNKEMKARTVEPIEGIDYKIGYLKMFINKITCQFICNDEIVEIFFCGIRPSTLSHLEIDLKQKKSRLLWSQSESKMLEAIRCTVEETIGLTPANNLLLKSLGAEGNPRNSSKPWGYQAYHPLADLFQEIPGTSDSKYGSVINTGENPPQLTEMDWVISGVAKRRKIFGFRPPQWLENAGFRFLECHVFIIVEGILNNRRFIVKIDLITENIKTETGNITAGRIQLNPWIKYDKFLKEAKYYEAQQFLTKRAEGFEFVSNIHEESWQKINYSKVPFKKQFNCITWVHEKLQKHFPRDYNPQTEWYNLLYRPPSDVILPRGNALQNFVNVFINFPPEVIVLLIAIIVAFLSVRLMLF